MMEELYQNKPRDFVVDSGHCPIEYLRKNLVDYRAIIAGDADSDRIKPGVQIVRIVHEKPDGRRIASGKYFVIVVKDVSDKSFAELIEDQEFILQTPQKEAKAWAETMREIYAGKKTRQGKLAFPNGLEPQHRFMVYSFTPIMTSNADEFAEAQWRFYRGQVPTHLQTQILNA